LSRKGAAADHPIDRSATYLQNGGSFVNRIDPPDWTTDVLIRLVNPRPAFRIDDLMPWAYAGQD
jgi:hypothetical protein